MTAMVEIYNVGCVVKSLCVECWLALAGGLQQLLSLPAVIG